MLARLTEIHVVSVFVAVTTSVEFWITVEVAVSVFSVQEVLVLVAVTWQEVSFRI
jgi:hypothetical protein